MRKKMMGAFLVIVLLAVIIIGILLVSNEMDQRNPFSELIYPFEYNIDIDMDYDTTEELEAINTTLILPYEDLLGQTRYDEGKNLSEKRTSIHFMDSVVEEDGKRYVNTKKSSLKSGRYNFEFKLSCRFFENITITQEKSRNSDGYIIGIEHPELQRVDSFWANYPPYAGFLRNNTMDINFPDEGIIYHDGFIVDGIENHTASYILNDVYFIAGLTEIGSSHMGGLGNGNGVDQYVILDEDHTPILIIANKFEWDS
jgi:hypothetical protein